MLVATDDKVLNIERHVFLIAEDGEHYFNEKCPCCMNYLDKWEARFYHQQQEKMVYEKVYVHNPFAKTKDVAYKKRTFDEKGNILDNETLMPI